MRDLFGEFGVSLNNIRAVFLVGSCCLNFRRRYFWIYKIKHMSKEAYNKIVAKLERMDEYLAYLKEIQKVNKKVFFG